MKYHLSRIQDSKHLNAFLSVYAEEALARAAQIDLKIRNGKAGKLAGLVVGVKDVVAYQSHPLQAGSRMLEGYQAAYHATAVQRLLDEDAIIIGRQNCDEFAMGSSNENSAFGPALNPHNTSRVPGGSSGGSAVAVAADLCQVSIGSDTGGSVRQPASFCGVLGLKPTYGRISRYGLVAYASSFDCIGIFGRHAGDIATVLSVIAGPDSFDSTVSHKPVPDYTSEIRDDRKYKIALLGASLHAEAVQSEIREALESTAQKLKGLGHTVENVEFPLMDQVLPTYYILATAEASSNLSRYDGVRYGHRTGSAGDLEAMYKRSRKEGFGKEVQRRILLGTFVLSADYYDAYYAKAQKVRRLIRDATTNLLTRYDFLLTPTAPTTAFKLGAHTQHPLEMYLADLFSVQANVAGVPGISIPVGKDNQGLPIGLQAIAADFREADLLRLARYLQVN